MLLSHMDIASASIRTPGEILVFVGPSGEGRALLLCDLMGAVWGGGQMVDQPSILHAPGEFRKQGHLYRGIKWISIDEGRPHLGVEEEVFNIFVSGGSLRLRKNREPGGRLSDWPRCGKIWSLNPGDVPRVQIATASAFSRRLRCVRMRARFSAKTEEIDPQSLISQPIEALRDWFRSGEASSVSRATILMPISRKSPSRERGEKIRIPTAQIAGDTEWHVRKMARAPVRNFATNAETVPGGPGVSGESRGLSERIVRGNHICALALDFEGMDMWAGQICKMGAVAENYAVKKR